MHHRLVHLIVLIVVIAGAHPASAILRRPPPIPNQLPRAALSARSHSGNIHSPSFLHGPVDVIVPADDGINQGETTIVAIPQSPGTLICSSNDYRGDGNGSSSPQQIVYTSFDDGATWTNTKLQSSSNAFTYNSDPSLAVDARGWVYCCYGTISNITGENNMYVSVSRDFGRTWLPPMPILADSFMTDNNDKYFIAADANPASPFHNNVYCSWTVFSFSGTDVAIRFARSTDGGVTWSTPYDISPSGDVQFSMPAVAGDGTVYVSYCDRTLQNSSSVALLRSTNGGASFVQLPNVAGDLPSATLLTLYKEYGLRAAEIPSIAVDQSTLHPGRIYASWTTVGADTPHVYLTWSDTRGQSFVPAKIIDGDTAGYADKFQQWVAIDPTSGTVGVSYYNTSGSTPKNTDYWIALSRDGGATFLRKRLTETSFQVMPLGGSGYWSDYSALAVRAGKFYPCWTQTEPDSAVLASDVFMTTVGFGPAPVSNLAAVSSGTTSGDVLTWTDPTTTLMGDSLGAFSVLIYRDGILLHTVAKGMQTVGDSGLVARQSYEYRVVVVAGNDTSPIAAVTFVPGGATIPVAPLLQTGQSTTTGAVVTWKNPSRHIDGSPLTDFHMIYFGIEGATIDSVQMSVADTSAIESRIVNIPGEWRNRFVKISIFAATRSGNIVTIGESSDSQLVFAGNPRLLDEGFERAPNYGTNGAWGLTSASAHGGTNAITDSPLGASTADANTFFVLPPTVINIDKPYLSFWHIALIQDAVPSDSGLIDISTDGMLSWTPIALYTKSSAPEFGSDLAHSRWKHELVDLSGIMNDTAFIRYRLHTSAALSHLDGWYVDDITLAPFTKVADGASSPSNSILHAWPVPLVSGEPGTVSFDVVLHKHITLRLIDATGTVRKNFIDGVFDAGQYRTSINTVEMMPGAYFLEFTCGSNLYMHPLIIIK